MIQKNCKFICRFFAADLLNSLRYLQYYLQINGIMRYNIYKSFCFVFAYLFMFCLCSCSSVTDLQELSQTSNSQHIEDVARMQTKQIYITDTIYSADTIITHRRIAIVDSVRMVRQDTIRIIDTIRYTQARQQTIASVLDERKREFDVLHILLLVALAVSFVIILKVSK